jgi:hypothetical protein
MKRADSVVSTYGGYKMQKKFGLAIVVFMIFSGRIFAENIPGIYYDLQNLEKNDSAFIVNILNGDIFKTFSKALGSYDTDLKKSIYKFSRV